MILLSNTASFQATVEIEYNRESNINQLPETHVVL